MEQNFKPITKQLTIATLILVSVTILSLGIRQVRFSKYRADFSEPAPPVDLPDIESQPQPDKKLVAMAETNYYQEDSYAVDAEPDPDYTDESDWDKQAYSEEYDKSDESGKALSKAKSSMDRDAKAKASKSLEKISLSDYDDLYVSKKGEFWYVGKEPDGSAIKMQVQIDKVTGELIPVDSEYYTKAKNSQDLYRINMSDNEDIYISKEGQAWYVSEQPDGSTAKIQVPTD